MASPVSQIASAAGIVSAATLLSRLLGFVRDMAIAWLFGAGMAADAFFAAFRLPSTFRELLGEGALSAAFIPVFTRTATRDGRPAAWGLASRVMGTLAMVLGAVTALGMLFAPEIAALLTPGWASEPEKLALTAKLLRIMFPYLFLVGLSALFMAILNSLGHFLTPALAPAMLNLTMIAVGLWIAPRMPDPALWLGGAVVAGGLGQLLIQIPPAVARGWRGAVQIAPRDPGVQEIARLMLPGVGGLAVTQVNVFVGMVLASFLAEGSLAALQYAFRLVQFPIGVVGVAIGTAALPVMAAAVAREAREEMRRSLTESLRLGLFLALPAMAGLIAFREPIVHALYERGAFDRSATLLAANVLTGYAVGLGFYVSNRILAPAFYAMRDTTTPVLTNSLSVALNIAASLFLMGPLGAMGLALATAIASCGNCIVLCGCLRRRMGRMGLTAIGRGSVRIILACLPLVLWSLLAQRWWSIVAMPGTLAKAALLALQLAVAGGLFLATAALLRCEELRWLRETLSRRTARRRASPD
ncbi:MAG: murein biosynthesis integral membrane protein MurJ [candidate division NC10 bacterium]|nr:murein biosynthesis integral membrane protein MurJ [candidate division NC10 bacterium]